MKRFLFISTAICLLTACTSDESQQERGQIAYSKSIAFDCYLGNTAVTRAMNGNMTTDELKQAGFGVYGYYTETADYASNLKPNFMCNEKIYWSGADSKWNYDNQQFWPNGENNKLSFFAYAPYVESAENEGIISLPSNSVASDPVIGYKMGTGSNVDLLWGTNEEGKTYQDSPYKLNIDMTKQGISDRIHFAFKHTLANVAGAPGCLKVLLDVDAIRNSITEGASLAGFDTNKTKVTLKSVTIRNASDTGAPVTSGTFNLATGQWTLGTETGSFEYTFSTATSGLLNSAIAEPSSVSSWSDISDVDGITLSPQDVISSSAAASMPLIAFIPGQAPKISVTADYYIRTSDSKLDRGFSELHQVITNEVSLPTLQMNSKYTLYIHLGLTSVKFSAAVDAWDGSSSTVSEPIDLPSNVE